MRPATGAISCRTLPSNPPCRKRAPCRSRALGPRPTPGARVSAHEFERIELEERRIQTPAPGRGHSLCNAAKIAPGWYEIGFSGRTGSRRAAFRFQFGRCRARLAQLGDGLANASGGRASITSTCGRAAWQDPCRQGRVLEQETACTRAGRRHDLHGDRGCFERRTCCWICGERRSVQQAPRSTRHRERGHGAIAGSSFGNFGATLAPSDGHRVAGIVVNKSRRASRRVHNGLRRECDRAERHRAIAPSNSARAASAPTHARRAAGRSHVRGAQVRSSGLQFEQHRSITIPIAVWDAGAKRDTHLSRCGIDARDDAAAHSAAWRKILGTTSSSNPDRSAVTCCCPGIATGSRASPATCATPSWSPRTANTAP